MANLTIKQLRYFDALAQHGHFGRAADACAISQPALSMRIKELEEELGTPLVERGPRQLRLTPFGEDFVAKAREVLRGVDELGDLARAAKDAGVSRFVQVSAIGADRNGPSTYAQAKALGEELVRDAFPKATILRPSIIFGPDGGILNLFADLIASLPVLPVFAPDSPLQVVHVDDVAAAITKALLNPSEFGGKIYELAGPDRWTMMELNQRIATAQRRKRTFLPMPDGLSATFAALPGTPMGSDQWKLLKQGNVVSGEYPGFDKLGIEPRPLELFLDRWMVRYRKHGRFHAEAA